MEEREREKGVLNGGTRGGRDAVLVGGKDGRTGGWEGGRREGKREGGGRKGRMKDTEGEGRIKEECFRH